MQDFEIGVITKAQGIRGEFRVFPTTDRPSQFEFLVGEEIKINGVPLKLEKTRLQKNIVILKFGTINDRNAAEKMIGAKITISQEQALPLEDGEYFVRDLLGLAAETEDGEALGKLTQVLHTGANDVYVIAPPRGDSFMIPAIKDVIVKVCLDEGKIILRLMDGLRELKE